MSEENYIRAAAALSICELTDNSGNTRIIEPYMVFTTSKQTRSFHCYQLSGYSESTRTEGWKNIPVDTIASAQVTDDGFVQRAEYNPFNEKLFPQVHFSIPTNDGRQR